MCNESDLIRYNFGSVFPVYHLYTLNSTSTLAFDRSASFPGFVQCLQVSSVQTAPVSPSSLLLSLLLFKLCVLAEDTKDDWVYLIKLHLQDATGEVDAALFDKDADEFFQVSYLIIQSCFLMQSRTTLQSRSAT